MTRVKICGIKSESELELAVLCGADAVGFITEVPVATPRRLSMHDAARLIKKVPLFVTPVVVIMPKNAEQAVRLVRGTGACAVQVHQKVSNEVLAALRSTGVKVIQTVHAEPGSMLNDMLEQVKVIENADAVLLDSAGSGKPGGTGQVHDWDISAAVVKGSRLPVILAGGLNPGNVEDAVRAVNPYAVDVASGVETGGMKDAVKVSDFIRKAKSCGV